MPPKLRVVGVRKSYGGVVALAETSLDLREGEFLTLLGPSGSGKTTLLMTVAGLIAPNAGEIWIDGRDASGQPPWERDIGMVFQNYALFPHYTVFENIAFPLRMRRHAAANVAQEVERILDIVRLGHVAGRLPSQLSGGQQQRVALARALVYRPSIVLMDEPLGALDKKLRDQLQIEIKQLHEALKATILYVTHDQQEALTMSDRICLMQNGRIEQIGTPQDLYFRPQSVFAADFLGESNILPGRIVSHTDGYATVVLDGESDLRLVVRSDQAVGPASLMVRPECLVFLDDQRPGAFEGRIASIVFIGGTTKYLITLSGGATISLNETTRRDMARHRGERVRFGFAPEDGVILRAT